MENFEKTKSLFPAITPESANDPNRVVLQLGYGIRITYQRDPVNGDIIHSPLDTSEQIMDGDAAGLIGRQWQSRADAAAREYFDSHPAILPEAAE